MVICKIHVAVYRQMDMVIYIYHIADTQTDDTKLFFEKLYVSGLHGGNCSVALFYAVPKRSWKRGFRHFQD